jgi:hypothetical protein
MEAIMASKSSSTKSGKSSGGKSKSRSSGRHRGSAGSQTTTNPEEIRAWAEKRGGRPACVKGTGGKADTGLLRIDFPGYGDDEKLQPIEWDEFFEKFEEQKLAMVYQDQTSDGETSRFSKLVKRTAGRGSGAKPSSGSRGASRGRPRAKANPGSRARESTAKAKNTARRQKNVKTRR